MATKEANNMEALAEMFTHLNNLSRHGYLNYITNLSIEADEKNRPSVIIKVKCVPGAYDHIEWGD